MTAAARDETPQAEHILYRMYDADGVLLYIGITVNVPQRFGSHAATKPWWPFVETIKLERFPTEAACRDAERVAIRSENPTCNVVHGPLRRQPREFRGSVAPDPLVQFGIGIPREKRAKLVATAKFLGAHDRDGGGRDAVIRSLVDTWLDEHSADVPDWWPEYL